MTATVMAVKEFYVLHAGICTETQSKPTELLRNNTEGETWKKMERETR